MKYKIEKEEFEEIIKKCLSKAQVCRELGMVPAGGSYKAIDSKIRLWNIDISHFTGQGWNQGIYYKQIRKTIPLEEILVENSTYSCNRVLKKRLIKEKLKVYKCECCGISEWNNKPITLELNHIDGINNNYRLENIEFLCPNCHSQTNNFRGKNKKKSAKRQVSEKKYKEFLNMSEEEKNLLKEKNKYKKTKKIKKQIEKENCLNCNKEFLPKKRGKHFCCLECYKIYQRKRIPNKEDIINSFSYLKSFIQVGKKYNVSDNAVRKWCEAYGILEDMKNIKKQS
jgi:hypothetical protein